jgi:multidrug transporter EmrE-like cation transporter
MMIRTLFPIAGWLICFAILNVFVKDIARRIFIGSLLDTLLNMARSPMMYVAATLYIACAFLYFLALSRLPLSTAGPVFMVLGVVTTTVLGFSLFGEQMSPLKLLGTGVCLLGTFMLLCGTPD